jgi:hypothetical protein
MDPRPPPPTSMSRRLSIAHPHAHVLKTRTVCRPARKNTAQIRKRGCRPARLPRDVRTFLPPEKRTALWTSLRPPYLMRAVAMCDGQHAHPCRPGIWCDGQHVSVYRSGIVCIAATHSLKMMPVRISSQPYPSRSRRPRPLAARPSTPALRSGPPDRERPLAAAGKPQGAACQRRCPRHA